jgi:Tfp pilus assembly protein PilO
MNDKKFLPPLILALIIILSVGWYKFIYESAQREILNMELETRRLREVEREILELKARHEDLAAFIEEKELQLDDARNFLPPTLAQEKFIDELYRTADSVNVRIISIRTGEVNSSGEIQSQDVNVKLDADYISLMNFIREILDGGRLINLEKIFMEKSSGKILSCELSFKIFAAAP